MKLQHLFFFCAFLLTACGDDPAIKEGEVYDIRTIGILSTTEYTVGKVVKLSDEGEWYKWGDRRILMSCKARIKAGIDLSKLKDQDIKADGSRIEITLPAPEIVSFEMDPNQTKTEMTDVSGMRWDFTQVEKNHIMQLGEKAIREDLDQLNILQDAENNAKAFLNDFYSQLGFEEIIIHGTNKTAGSPHAD